MGKSTRWTRFGSLMTGIVVLLVFGLAPMASARKWERGVWKATWAEQQAKQEAAKVERVAASKERRAQWEAAREERAAKIASRKRQRGTDSGVIGPEGGTLMVSYWGGRGGKDNVWVQFIVPKNALTEPKDISMTLDLDTEDLSNLTLIFTPSGLHFDIPAILKIKLGKEMAEELGYQSMVGLHYSKSSDSDGELVEEMPLIINPGRLGVEVMLNVPGFSRYSIGDGI